MNLPKELSHMFYKVEIFSENNNINVVLPEGTIEHWKGKLCKVSVEQAIVKQCTIIETDPEQHLVFKIDLPQPYSYLMNTLTNVKAQNQTLWKIPINMSETSDYFYNGFSNGNGIIAFFQNNFTITVKDITGNSIPDASFESLDISLRITPFLD